uniref:Glutathione synthetase n=1 Tax=Sparus aurata TaxID=8175 RepID=A0A671UF08_SPAAU
MATEAILQRLITNPERLKDLVDKAKDVALQSGMVIRTKEKPNSSEVVTYYPFSLFPTPVPKAAFLQALAVQTHFNTLVDKISQDPDFLEEALASTIQADDFTAKLFDIYRHVQQEGRTQPIVVGLLRSDYMLDQGECRTSSLKQIEINTISVAGFGVIDRVPEVHRYLRTCNSVFIIGLTLFNQGNCVLSKSFCRAVILFLFEDVQTSIINHRCMEKELCNRNIPVIRRKFEDVSRRGSLDDDKKLFVDGLEVAVVYYRTGYMPNHYTEQAWDARLMMERSLAVKLPDIGTQLAGTKKVQQVLSKPGVLEKFFPDQPRVVERIRATFAGLYTLDMGLEGDKTVEMALAAPDQFVLKPQREGGGNNIYGSDICQVLQQVKESTERTAYILMDKIQPTPVQNYMLRRDFPLQISNCDSELGVFGVYVRQGKDTVMNECVGHLLRTKSSEVSEGGLTTGICVVDSPLLL